VQRYADPSALQIVGFKCNGAIVAMIEGSATLVGVIVGVPMGLLAGIWVIGFTAVLVGARGVDDVGCVGSAETEEGIAVVS